MIFILKRNVFIRLLALILCFSMILCPLVLAAPGADDPQDGREEQQQEEQQQSTTDLGTQFEQEISNFNAGSGAYSAILQIAGIMLWVAIVICIFKMIMIGIKFMTSGTGKGRQEAKASLLPFLIGAVVCFLFVTLGSEIITQLVSGVSGGVFDV